MRTSPRARVILTSAGAGESLGGANDSERKPSG